MKLTRREAIVVLALALVGAITLITLAIKGACWVYQQDEKYSNYMNNR